ncbi:MAG: LapA family protein [Deltaproteobacteria bacterium]|nr:LapA family protein [Deltaproteobacteria bacterium]
MIKAKLVAAFVLVVVLLIVVFQNTQPMETKFLFMSVTMPRAALIAVTFLIGLAVGVLAALSLAARTTKKD